MPSSVPRSDLAVSVRGVSKSYTIAHEAQKHTLASEALLHSLKNIGKKSTSETFWALKDVSFDINKGDVVGIIGRNGAGKSTLLKILSRITEPTSGRIDLYGRVGSLLEVGTGFHPELTGRENVYLNGAILGMSKREIAKHFDAIVEFAGVEKFLDTPVKRYSSGMYVRLAFAVAAHLEPEILIVDEVLAVGDAEFQKKCLGKMQDVAAHGRTVIFVSHNMGSLRKLCTSAHWLEKGRVVMSGSASEVVDRYLKAGVDESKSVINVAEVVRRYGLGERLRVCRVEFNQGQPVFHGERLSVQIDYEAKSPVVGIGIGVGLSTLEGTRLMTFESNTNGSNIDVAAGQRGSVTLEVDSLWLQPGQYSLDVGAGSATSGLDGLLNCATIEVLPGLNTPPTLYQGEGGVRPPAAWHWNQSQRRFGSEEPSLLQTAKQTA